MHEISTRHPRGLKAQACRKQFGMAAPGHEKGRQEAGASYTGKPKPASTPARCSYALVNGSRSPLKTKRLPQRAQFPAKQVVCRGYAVLFATECIEPALRSIAPHHNSTSSRACKSMDFWARRYGSVGVGPALAWARQHRSHDRLHGT